ncbi:MAG TPA: EamA family transporter, partial [Thermoanaerobaculia bacterium]
MTDSRGTLRASALQVAAALGAVYLIWGSTYLAIRFAIETIPPFLMAAARYLTAGAMLYAWSRLRGAPRPRLIHWRPAVMLGGLLLLLGNGGVVWAEQRVSSGLAALLVSTEPLWIVLFVWMRDHGRPAGRVLLGLLLGFTGLVLLVRPT